MALKEIVNRSSHKLTVTLFLRYGDDPLKDAGAKSFTLNPGATERISQTMRSLQMNGIAIGANSDEVAQYCERKILKQGSDLDLLLNTNDLLAISVPASITLEGLVAD